MRDKSDHKEAVKNLIESLKKEFKTEKVSRGYKVGGSIPDIIIKRKNGGLFWQVESRKRN